MSCDRGFYVFSIFFKLKNKSVAYKFYTQPALYVMLECT